MTPNITPDDATGIGRWSKGEFSRAMHEGRGRNGAYLYPAFPYPYFNKVSREDTDAIYDYLRTLAPVTNAVNRRTLPFPFNIRTLMAGWNALFFKPAAFAPDPQRSAEFNRGAYLVEGLGHCGACHTPLNAFGANKPAQFLQGNRIDDWTAPNITNDQQAGLGKWSVEEVVQYLKTGQTRSTIASGPMREVVEDSTSKMSDDDLRAMAVYLKERGAAGPAGACCRSRHPIHGCRRARRSSPTPAAHAMPAMAPASSTCFRVWRATLSSSRPIRRTLIRIVLTGVRGAGTDAFPTSPAMPSFGYRLDDRQVAAVVTYIRNSWGNAASAVDAEMVRGLRSKVAGPVERSAAQ